jgi:dTDP-4-amino-4,6-dideoxygalactose transaminase
MSRRIPVFTPFVTQEMKEAAIRVLDSGHYIRTTPDEASEGLELEREFGAFLAAPDGRRPYVANVANGTAAMHLAWVACGIGPGDEVIVPANTFSSVAHCVSLAGATPVFVDVEPDIYNMDAAAAAAAVTPRTRAIMPVHTAGHPADMDPIIALGRQHDLLVVEDACQAIGARYRGRAVGTLGHVGCYSFVQNKAMTCGGEGGAVGSYDELRVRRVFTLANHARGERFHEGNATPSPYRQVIHDGVGFNYRQSELLSAIARVQLRLLPGWLQRRKHLVALYRRLLTDAGLPVQQPAERSWADHSYVRFEIRTPQRDAVRQYLKQQGVGTAVHYPTPLHLDDPYREQFGYREGMLPVSERLSQEILGLPLYPQMGDDDVAYVVDHLKAFFKQRLSAAV